ncbi:Lrp/AsnC family transcriptional regulator [Euzebya sp.]|uniref:Lrp/AsnC family transcriptional regulator n=1 Tax=Euzebya sp. TaxID=1971409 RepID=UPI003515E0F1
MDRLDREILTHLQRDGRMSNAELARRIRLSPTPTLRRVRALEDAGVITGYHAAVDLDAVDRGFRVLVWVDLVASTTDYIETFEEAVLEADDVLEAHRLFGEPDYLLRVAVRDATAYEHLYTTTLSALPGIRRAVSQIAMKTVKEGGAVPVGVSPPPGRSR